MRILLVEDENAVLSAVHDILFDAFDPLEMTTCGNGSEALLACMNHKYDLIVTDFKMPVMNGLDFVSILRRCDCDNQNTAVIFLSGFVPLIKDNGSVFEDVHFMEKPVHIKRFLNLISMLCKVTLKRAAG